jgi:hypothetical protein
MSKFNVRKSVIALMFGIVVLAGSESKSQAAFVTGDPAADQWQMLGGSRSLGTYIRGTANWNYDVYRNSFYLSATDTLLGTIPSSWTLGDLILGIGAVVNTVLPDTTDVIAKISVLPPSTGFSPSSTLIAPGDGRGSFSQGNGGLNSILVRWNNAQGVGLATPDVTGRWDGLVLPNGLALIDPTVAVMKSKTTAAVLNSFEVLLNATALFRNYGLPVPAPGNTFDLALQNNTGPQSIDAYGTLAAPAVAPAPSSIILMLSGLVCLGFRFRRQPALV